MIRICENCGLEEMAHLGDKYYCSFELGKGTRFKPKEEKMKRIHKLDIIEKTSECGNDGDAITDIDVVNCLDCLELEEQEWKRQTTYMKNQPLVNAKNGLKRTKKRIKEVRLLKEEGNK